MRVTVDIVDGGELAHYNVPGAKWYQHKFGKWQKQAQYAAGQDDPNAKPASTLHAVAAAQKKPTRKEQKAAVAAAKAEAQRAETERIRKMTHDKVMQSTDPREIYTHREELTTNELRELVDRTRYAQALKDAIDSESFKQAQAVQQRQSKGKEAINKVLKKLGDAGLEVGGTLAKQGLQYAAKKGLEEAFGKDVALQITDPQAYKAQQDKAKEAAKAKFVQNNMQAIVNNPNKYTMEQLNAANVRLSTIRSLSSEASIFDQKTFDNMVEHPESYSANDLARAAQQAEQMNKIINRKTVKTK